MKLNAFTCRLGSGFTLEMPELELEPGAVYAVIGANGSGKSTLARAAAGLLKTEHPVTDERSIAYMPQSSFAFRMSLRANLLLTGGTEERADALIDALGLTPLANRPAKRLSGGETARMALARVLMRPCGLLVLDEPCASMDIESTCLAEKCITDYVRETDCTALISTHSIQQAERIADRVLFLHGGRLIESGDTEMLLYSPQEEETMRFLRFYGFTSK